MKNNKLKKKKCIICNFKIFLNAFPYKTYFNNKIFNYKKCKNCKYVFINPIPSKIDFKKMYKNEDYHVNFYDKKISNEYIENFIFLRKFLKKNDHIVDYGCGYGHFLKLIPSTYKKTGIELNSTIVKICKKKLKHINFLTSSVFYKSKFSFNVFHLGDVLEHLPNPLAFLKKNEHKLKTGGLIYITGPLERNFSIVCYVFLFYGFIKNLIFKNSKYFFKPYHLSFFNLSNQLLLLKKLNQFEIIALEVYETGFPYNKGNILKKIIAIIAILFSKLNIFGFSIGNRVRIILKKN